VLDYIELFYRGLPPVQGGALDQSRWFIQAAQFVRADQSVLKAAKGIVDG